jgi:hypothetical protein
MYADLVHAGCYIEFDTARVEGSYTRRNGLPDIPARMDYHTIAFPRQNAGQSAKVWRTIHEPG